MKFPKIILSLFVSFLITSQAFSEEIRFTSVPDIFNWNISNPQPGWENVIGWFFDRLQQDGPDFTLNAGDIMDARWWDNSEPVSYTHLTLPTTPYV